MPFNKAAARGSLVGQPGANTVAPIPAVVFSRSRSPRTSGRLAPARMTPIVSSTTSFACRCTSFGTCSSVVSATKRASLSICCAICVFLLVLAKLREIRGAALRARYTRSDGETFPESDSRRPANRMGGLRRRGGDPSMFHGRVIYVCGSSSWLGATRWKFASASC
jgi:hypothetical protein